MALTSANLKTHKPVMQVIGALNGGRKSLSLIQSGVKNAIFPDITNEKRIAGSTDYAKVFLSVESIDDTPMLDSKIMVEAEPSHEVCVVLVAGTPTENQGEFLQSISTTPRKEYGAGTTDVAWAIDDWDIEVVLFDSQVFQFAVGDVVRLANGDSAEYLEIDSITPISSVRQGLSFKSPLVLDHAVGATVSSCIMHPEVKGVLKSYTLTPVVNPTGNTEAINPALLQVHSLVSEYQMVTFTFNSSVSFSCAGDSIGTLGAGNVGNSFTPINASTGLPYFTIPPEFWIGAWAKGDILIAELTSFDIPVWIKRVSKPNCSPASLDGFILLHDGESA